MEISLEKIELVKDRTGVSYREAKDALNRAGGSVVDAIILIEDEIDLTPKTAAESAASDMVGKIRDLVRKGNVSRIVIKKDGKTILNIPVTLGVLGAFFLPEAAILSTIVALGTKCDISVVTTDGSEVNVVRKASQKISSAKDSYSTVAGDLRDKGSDAFSKIKKKADDVISKVSSSDEEPYDDDYFNFDDEYPDPEDSEENGSDDDAAEAVKEAENAAAEADDAIRDAEEAVSGQTDSAAAEADDAEDKFQSAIDSFEAGEARNSSLFK